MNDFNLENRKNLSKEDLIQIILSLKTNKQRYPKPTPMRSVRDMVQDYENNIIAPPLEFRDDHEENIISPPLEFRDEPKPIEENIEIKELSRAFKGYTKSYEISIINETDPLIQLQSTRSDLKNHINKLLDELKSLTKSTYM